MINQPPTSPPTHSSRAIAPTLTSIVGSAGICAYADLTSDRQLSITQAVTPGTQVEWVVYPHTQAELAAVMACAAENHWPMLLCGTGQKLDWGGLAQGVQLVVSLERVNQLIEHAVGDLTVTVEAGMVFSELQSVLAQSGQFLPLDPLYPDRTTIGGLIATADTGSLRQRYGGVRDLLIGLSFVRADGQVAKAGGRVVKNVAGYDLMKLFTGSYGTLGAIAQATFRVYPLPEASQTVVLTGTPEAITQATKTLLASALTPTALDLLSPQTVAALNLGQGMGLLIRFQSISASVQEQAARSLELGQALNLVGSPYRDANEVTLWQALQEQKQGVPQELAITCKIGVLPSHAVATLAQIDLQIQGIGMIHGASGLGFLRCDSQTVKSQTLLEVRSLCQRNGGFLSILQAPIPFKQQLDVWGYPGNALTL
ncbi:MAG: FAD-binding oxidoreductase, partial [Leptolyngbyaceae bacterium]|nr:FAD-binding oxidoreductase [Leptolyngbyaceae bacterium]